MNYTIYYTEKGINYVMPSIFVPHNELKLDEQTDENVAKWFETKYPKTKVRDVYLCTN